MTGQADDIIAAVFRALRDARANAGIVVAVRMSEAQVRRLWAQQHEAALNAGMSPDLLMPPLPAHLPVQDDGALPGYQVAGLPLYLHEHDEVQVKIWHGALEWAPGRTTAL